MNNHHQAPQSDLEAVQPVSKTKWKVFFWIILLFEILTLVIIIIDHEKTSRAIVVEIMIYPIIVTGVFGFAYDKKIFFRQLWAYLIPIGIAYDIYSFARTDWEFESTKLMYVTSGVIAAFVLPIMICQYLALYKYSSKSPEIWGASG